MKWLICIAGAAVAVGFPVEPGEQDARSSVLQEMRRRPGDLWPRGFGHVILAEPGSTETAKSYLEPGGAFSPAPGSFGVSVWITDSEGGIAAASETLPLEQLTQQIHWTEGERLPAFSNWAHRQFECRWTLLRPGRWRLNLERRPVPEEKTWLVFRSVGPAGGPIQALRWDGRKLLINDRWTVTFQQPPAAVFLGSEHDPEWKTGRPERNRWEGQDGWGYARTELSPSQSQAVTIEDSTPATRTPLPFRTTRAQVEMELPSAAFIDSLHAQSAHLMMGLSGRETRPGDPLNYPLQWLRDGAYVLTALARAGHVDTARELAKEFAEKDFFGGFGAEADAPGLALWALQEVALRVDRRDYDRSLWPHVQRKAELILRMLSSPEPIRLSYSGPVVPAHRDRQDLDLVADPARDGLIQGRMDHHRPLLFVNAVSYRGLLDAAALADRIGEKEQAVAWRSRAAELRKAWHAALAGPESPNERTYASGQWPSWIVGSDSARFKEGLQSRWGTLRDADGRFRERPLWTYFSGAEAHQWLLLGDADKAWKTVEWLWKNQASPGLFTWWEGAGEENSFGLWNGVRGWVRPPHVTPHYWTAAEVLLLQLDMLAFADESAPEPALVIGAGVRKEWLEWPMRVENVWTRQGRVNWSWDRRRVRVWVESRAIPRIRLGAAFPASSEVIVRKQ